MVYGNRRSNYVLRNHASSPIGLSAISSISSIASNAGDKLLIASATRYSIIHPLMRSLITNI